MPFPGLETLVRAHHRIRRHIHRTPVLTSGLLDARAGAPLFFKAENLQKIGAFKARGALNAVLSLDPAVLHRGLATHSSGNHGAALAYAGRLAAAPVHVVMPENSLPNKLAAVRGYGAAVTLCSLDPSDREAVCERVLRDTGASLIHPYDDDAIIAGQGTAAMEFLEQVADLDLILAPVGGGGLIAGTAIAARALRPGLRVIAAEPALSADAYHSWHSGKCVAPESTATIADGLRAGVGRRNLEIMRHGVDDVLLVKEEGILEALKLILHHLKTVVEPSAAVPLAAVLEHPETFAGRRTGIILSGGNLDLENPPWLPSAGS